MVIRAKFLAPGMKADKQKERPISRPPTFALAFSRFHGTTACTGALGWLSGPPVLKPVTVTLTFAPAVRPVNIASDSSASFVPTLSATTNRYLSARRAASQFQDT